MRPRSRALCAALLLLPCLAAAATPEEEATRTVREVVDRVLEILRTPGLESSARKINDLAKQTRIVASRDS